MKYQMRAHRREGGGYDFSFGRVPNNLKAVAEIDDLGFWHCSGDGPAYEPTKKLKDLKAAWGEWAEQAYNGTDGGDTEVASPTTPPKSSSGPPSFKPKSVGGPPAFKPSSGPPAFKPTGPPQRWGIWRRDHEDWYFNPPFFAYKGRCEFPSQAAAQDAINRSAYDPTALVPLQILDDQPMIDVDEANPYLCDVFDPEMHTPQGKITAIGALDEVFNFVNGHLPDEMNFNDYPWKSVALVLRRHFPASEKYKESPVVAS